MKKAIYIIILLLAFSLSNQAQAVWCPDRECEVEYEDGIPVINLDEVDPQGPKHIDPVPTLPVDYIPYADVKSSVVLDQTTISLLRNILVKLANENLQLRTQQQMQPALQPVNRGGDTRDFNSIYQDFRGFVERVN